MGVPLVLPHTSLTIPARSLLLSHRKVSSVFFGAAYQVHYAVGGPKTAPIVLRARNLFLAIPS